jgi:hypothetical protein
MQFVKKLVSGICLAAFCGGASKALGLDELVAHVLSTIFTTAISSTAVLVAFAGVGGLVGLLLWPIIENKVGNAFPIRSREATIHDFLRYVGITVGDVSDASRQKAEAALTKLRRLAASGLVTICGTQIFVGQHGFDDTRPSQRIPPEYWLSAFIYAPSAIESRNPLLIKTTLEPLGDVELPLFNGLRLTHRMISQNFQRDEFKPVHVPSFRHVTG